MSEATFIVTQTGLSPADDEAKDVFRRWKLGAVVRSDFKQMRNGLFFRKWWALVQVGYDYWEDTCETREYKGQPVRPNFERFRKDITILAGFFTSTFNVNGEVRLEAESLKWSSMTEERFTKLYDATIQVLLTKVFNGARVKQWTEAELRGCVEEIVRFAA